MAAEAQFVIQYSFRRRLDDAVGLGLLALATALSFTGLVDLARSMHPIRFALLLATAFCTYRVITRTFMRLQFTDAGIESHTPLRKVRRWQYHQLSEIRRAPGKRQSLRLRFSDGSLLTVDSGVLNAADLLPFLQQRVDHLIINFA